MTESTNPTPLSADRAEQIKTDLTAMLHKAAKVSAQANPSAATATTAATDTAAPEQKPAPTAQ